MATKGREAESHCNVGKPLLQGGGGHSRGADDLFSNDRVFEMAIRTQYARQGPHALMIHLSLPRAQSEVDYPPGAGFILRYNTPPSAVLANFCCFVSKWTSAASLPPSLHYPFLCDFTVVEC